MIDNIIEVCGLCIQFGSYVIYDGLDLDLKCGEILGVVGGFGIGKLVLLCIIVGLIILVVGKVWVLGQDVGQFFGFVCEVLEWCWGVMFQDGVLFFVLIVQENVEVFLWVVLGLMDVQCEGLVQLKVLMVGLLWNVNDKYFLDLLGGMKKCVGLVWVLVLDLEIVFLDEFIVGLDLIGVDVFDKLIVGLCDVLGLLVFLVMYDLDMLYVCCDRIVVLVEKKVLMIGIMVDMLKVDYFWVYEYFYGLCVCVVIVGKDQDMEIKVNYVLIGVFIIVGFFGFLVFMIWFVKLELNKQFVYYDIYFLEVFGFGILFEVGFVGLMVGKVIDMQIVDGINGVVCVCIEVQEDIFVCINFCVLLEFLVVIGLVIMVISVGMFDVFLLCEVYFDDILVIEVNRFVLQMFYDQGLEMILWLNIVVEQMIQLFGFDNQICVYNILFNVECLIVNLDKVMVDVSKVMDVIVLVVDDILVFGGKLDSLGVVVEIMLVNVDIVMVQFNEIVKCVDLVLEVGIVMLDQVCSYIVGDLQGLMQ